LYKRRGTIAFAAVAGAVAIGASARAGTPETAGVAAMPFMPHGMCYLWNPGVLALHIASDAVIALAYFSIPALLVHFVRKRPDIPFGRIFWMFGLFIVACGSTHVLGIWTIWHPAYWLSGVVKAITAAASIATALMLVPLIPKALQYKSPGEVEQHSTRQLQFVSAANDALTALTSVQATLEALLGIIVPSVAECVVINLLEGDGVLRVRAARAHPRYSETVAGLIGNSYATLDGSSPSARAIRTGQTQLLTAIDQANLRATVASPYLEIFMHVKPTSALVIPLMSGQQTLGTMVVLHSNEGTCFDDAETVLFETLARRAVIAIEQLRYEERAAYEGSHDALTRLPNQRSLAAELRVAMASERANDGPGMALLYVDLDRFKLVNDSLGHIGGDLILVATARRLESCLRDDDMLARVGADEFALLLRGVPSERDVVEIAERVVAELSKPFAVGEQEVFTTASIGIVRNSPAYHNSGDMMRDAETAMYRAKTLGRDRYAIFEPEMRDDSRKRLQLDGELRHALETGEIEVFYQPIVSCTSGDIEGFEALARWRHPTRGLIAPLEFIAIAEETGSILALGALVLRTACWQSKIWRDRLPMGRDLSITLTYRVRSYANPPTPTRFVQRCSRPGANPRPCIWRLPRPFSWTKDRRPCECFANCARSALKSTSTISEPVTHRSPISTPCRSTCSKSTVLSSAAAETDWPIRRSFEPSSPSRWVCICRSLQKGSKRFSKRRTCVHSNAAARKDTFSRDR